MNESNQIYHKFKEVGDHSYRSVIQFWTVHENAIRALPLDKYFEVHYEYCTALFEMSRYQTFLENIEELIGMSFSYNISQWENNDFLEYALLKKAAAHYHLYQTHQSIHDLQELLKLRPNHKAAKLLFERCIGRSLEDKSLWWKKWTFILMLSSAIVVALELFFVHRYMPSYTFSAEMVRTGLFIAGLLCWLTGEIVQRFSIKRQCRKFYKEIRKKRANF